MWLTNCLHAAHMDAHKSSRVQQVPQPHSPWQLGRPRGCGSGRHARSRTGPRVAGHYVHVGRHTPQCSPVCDKHVSLYTWAIWGEPRGFV